MYSCAVSLSTIKHIFSEVAFFFAATIGHFDIESVTSSSLFMTPLSLFCPLGSIAIIVPLVLLVILIVMVVGGVYICRRRQRWVKTRINTIWIKWKIMTDLTLHDFEDEWTPLTSPWGVFACFSMFCRNAWLLGRWLFRVFFSSAQHTYALLMYQVVECDVMCGEREALCWPACCLMLIMAGSTHTSGENVSRGSPWRTAG